MVQAEQVRVHHPLQQGLRPNHLWHTCPFLIVRVHHPLQQGLRPIKLVRGRYQVHLVRVHHPLQQGLRQFKWVSCADTR